MIIFPSWPVLLVSLLLSLQVSLQGRGVVRAQENVYYDSVLDVLYNQQLNVSRFRDAVYRGGLEDTLTTKSSSTQRWTLFVPTDSAMENAKDVFSQDVFHYPLYWTDFVEQHILPQALITNAMSGQCLKTALNAEPVLIQDWQNGKGGNNITGFHTHKIDNATIIIPNILAENGVVHVIDEIVSKFIVEKEKREKEKENSID